MRKALFPFCHDELKIEGVFWDYKEHDATATYTYKVTMDIHTLQKNETWRRIHEEKKASVGTLMALPAWKQNFTKWAEDVLCEKDADTSTLELCFDANEDDMECTEEEKRFTKKLTFRFHSPTTPDLIYGVLWAYTETNLLDGKFFIWQHTKDCCGYSCEYFTCPISTQ